MKKIKGFLFSESKLAKLIFGVFVVGIFALVFGPNIYAQFARQTGDAGWGYGYGYGYGYGSGFDGGTFAGYRTEGGAAALYEYDYGYGYIASGVTYDATEGYQVEPSEMAGLVTSGVMVPNGTDITNTTSVAFNDNVTLTVASGVTVTIPSGTTFTAGAADDFSALTAASGVSTTDLTGITVAGGAMSFGIPNLDLTVSPAITIAITVGTSYNGQNLSVYRKDATGTWGSVGSCTVSGGICSFTTTHLSSFATGTSTSSSSSSSAGGGGSSNSVACSSVTYGAYSAACFNGYQYRNVEARTPSNCTLTAAQQEAAKKACNVVDEATSVTVTGEGIISGDSNNSANFIALEKNLVKKINKALAKRLSGRILLQVEEKGEAWYVNPVNQAKYFLGRPADAFSIMRKLGLGISNKNFDSYKGKAPARLAGRILLKVESHGEAYYVNPVDLKMHYLGRPADAFSVMRTLGLGVNNTNLRQISVEEVK